MQPVWVDKSLKVVFNVPTARSASANELAHFVIDIIRIPAGINGCLDAARRHNHPGEQQW